MPVGDRPKKGRCDTKPVRYRQQYLSKYLRFIHFPAKLRIKNDPSLSGFSLLPLLKDNVFVNFLSDRAENGFQQQNGLRWVTCVEAVCLGMLEAGCGFNNKLEFLC